MAGVVWLVGQIVAPYARLIFTLIDNIGSKRIVVCCARRASFHIHGGKERGEIAGGPYRVECDRYLHAFGSGIVEVGQHIRGMPIADTVVDDDLKAARRHLVDARSPDRLSSIGVDILIDSVSVSW